MKKSKEGKIKVHTNPKHTERQTANSLTHSANTDAKPVLVANQKQIWIPEGQYILLPFASSRSVPPCLVILLCELCVSLLFVLYQDANHRRCCYCCRRRVFLFSISLSISLLCFVLFRSLVSLSSLTACIFFRLSLFIVFIICPPPSFFG